MFLRSCGSHAEPPTNVSQVRNDFSSLILQVEFAMAFEPRRDSFRVRQRRLAATFFRAA